MARTKRIKSSVLKKHHRRNVNSTGARCDEIRAALEDLRFSDLQLQQINENFAVMTAILENKHAKKLAYVTVASYPADAGFTQEPKYHIVKTRLCRKEDLRHTSPEQEDSESLCFIPEPRQRFTSFDALLVEVCQLMDQGYRQSPVQVEPRTASSDRRNFAEEASLSVDHAQVNMSPMVVIAHRNNKPEWRSVYEVHSNSDNP